MRKHLLHTLFLLCACLPVQAQTTALQRQIQDLIRDADATVGVAVLTSGGESFAVNDTIGFAMLSTFKFPLAMAVLHQLDERGTPLDTALLITKADLLPDTYSPLRDSCPEGNFRLPVRRLIEYAITLSDNNACDILLRFIGGPAALQQYIRNLGIPGIAIAADEALMHRSPENVYLNHARPSSAALLIDRFLQGNLLSPAHQQFLKNTMIATTTGTDKLRGMLPSSAVVGHKTGSSDRIHGMKIADNDIGFVLLPDGTHYSIAVFVMNSRESDTANAALIARISKLVYDHYLQSIP